MRLIIIAALAAVTTLGSGCASIAGSKVQPVTVATTCGSEPIVGAQCLLTNSKGSYNIASTPGIVMVSKASSDMAIQCKNGNVMGAPDRASSHANRAMWGNILVGGIVGAGVDAYTDMGWNYQDEYTVDLCRGMPQKVAAAIQTGATPAMAQAGGALTNAAYRPSGEMKWAMSAEAVAKQQQCNAAPRAILNERGPATEIYTVACTNGEALTLKCVWGECKAS